MGMHPDRARQVAGRSKAKPKRSDVSAHPNSVNPLKSKIRDLSRLLDGSKHLPADVRVEKERALAGYKQDLEHALREKQKQKMISKYHMVRFFERQKASRNLKKLKSRLKSVLGDDQEAAVRSAAHHAEVDLNYTIYYPLNEKYLSLFPRNSKRDTSESDRESPNGDSLNVATSVNPPPMWKVLEKAMEKGDLEALRDGKRSLAYLTSNDSARKKANATDKITKHAGKGLAENGVYKEGENEDGDESDGGFFER